MRMITVCAALVALIAASAEAQEAAAPAKEAVTDTMIIGSCGGPLAKMFAQFGTPRDALGRARERGRQGRGDLQL